MALTIEDGSLVEDADSFVSRADYITYADSKGITIADEEAADIELRQAVDFLCSHEGRLKGFKVDRDQAICFPRYNFSSEGFEWSSDEIPRQVILCQMALALEIHAGVDLYNPEINKVAKSESVDGAVDVEYFGKDNGVKLSKDSRALALLSSLLKNNGLFSIKMERS